VIGHVTPEAYVGGTIALVQDGDKITIDAKARTMTLDVSEEELEARRKQWVKPKPNYTRGILAKFAATAQSASRGAVTDYELDL
jgi:dihydroxy-acid dehydratase